MSLLKHGNFNQNDRITNFDPYSILYEIVYQIKIDLDYQVFNNILSTFAEVYLLEAKEDRALHVAVNITEITLQEKHKLEELLIDLDPYNNTYYYMFSFDNLDEKAQLFHPYYKNIKETLSQIKEIPFILEKEHIEASLSQPSFDLELGEPTFSDESFISNAIHPDMNHMDELNKTHVDSSLNEKSGKSGRVKI